MGLVAIRGYIEVSFIYGLLQKIVFVTYIKAGLYPVCICFWINRIKMAYDSVDWNFLDFVTMKMGLQPEMEEIDIRMCDDEDGVVV